MVSLGHRKKVDFGVLRKGHSLVVTELPASLGAQNALQTLDSPRHDRLDLLLFFRANVCLNLDLRVDILVANDHASRANSEVVLVTDVHNIDR